MLEDWRRCLGETGDVGIEAISRAVLSVDDEPAERMLVLIFSRASKPPEYRK